MARKNIEIFFNIINSLEYSEWLMLKRVQGEKVRKAKRHNWHSNTCSCFFPGMAPGFVVGLFRSGGIKDTETGYLRPFETPEVGRYGRTKNPAAWHCAMGFFFRAATPPAP
jgi:hypothetical protein